MPRIALKQLLRDLQASGVRRYVKSGSTTEVEFWAPDGPADAAAPVDRETVRDTKRPPLKDPLTVALKDDALDLPDGPEAN